MPDYSGAVEHIKAARDLDVLQVIFLLRPSSRAKLLRLVGMLPQDTVVGYLETVQSDFDKINFMAKHMFGDDLVALCSYDPQTKTSTDPTWTQRLTKALSKVWDIGVADPSAFAGRLGDMFAKSGVMADVSKWVGNLMADHDASGSAAKLLGPGVSTVPPLP